MVLGEQMPDLNLAQLKQTINTVKDLSMTLTSFLHLYQYILVYHVTFHSYRLLGCGMMLAWRRSKYTTIEIKGISVEKWHKIMKERSQGNVNSNDLDERTSITSSVRYTPTAGTVTIECHDATPSHTD